MARGFLLIHVFSPATVRHPWLATWATVALIVYAHVALYALFVYLLPWLCSLLGPFGWTPAPVTA